MYALFTLYLFITTLQRLPRFFLPSGSMTHFYTVPTYMEVLNPWSVAHSKDTLRVLQLRVGVTIIPGVCVFAGVDQR